MLTYWQESTSRGKPKMSEITLERINDRLFHETIENGSKIKWEKKPELLEIKITDVKVELCLSINKPSKTSINKIVSPIEAKRNENKKHEKLFVDKSDIEYVDRFGWHISEIGSFTKSRIGLIRKDGNIIWHIGDYDSADISITPVHETDKDKGSGWLFYMDDEIEKRPKPYLELQLFVSEKTLEKLCYEILMKNLTDLNVLVNVDVYMSEADRMLTQPNCFIDEQNPALLSEIWASRPIMKMSSSGNKKK
jgi:hypothetical protein